MKTRFLLIPCLLFCCAVSVAQSEVANLRKQLSHTSDSIHYTDVLNRLATVYSEIDADSTFYYADRANNIALRLKYARGQADAANNLGILQDLKGNTQQALRYYDDAYNRYSQMGDVPDMIQTTMNIAIVFYELEKIPKALNSLKSALTLGKNLQQDSIMSFVYANYVSFFLEDMADDSVQFYIQKSKQIAAKYNDYRMLLFTEQLTADNIATNQPEKAIAILQTALQAALAGKLYYTATDILIDLGNISVDSAKAVNYYLQSLSLSEQKGFTASVRYAYENLYDFYEARGDDAASLLYAEKLLYFYDEQKNLDNSSGIDYIDYALKNKELANSYARLQFHKRLFILTLIVCILSLCFIILLWRYAQKLKKAGKALKMQFEQAEVTAGSLDKVNKDYSRVIKMVAHDLRNPISNINIISTMMNSGAITPGEIQDFADIITKLSKNCFDLIEHLLTTNLNEEQQVIKAEVELNSLVFQCVRLLNFKAGEKKQQIIFSKKTELLLLADADKLTRVITNLVMNAIKFSAENSIIHLRTFLKERNAVIEIIDQGIGIPVDLQHKIFDPFTPAKRTGTNGEITFGLGLYISKRIVEAHGGIIWFNSMPGKGTAFYVQLPLPEKDFDNKLLNIESMQENQTADFT